MEMILLENVDKLGRKGDVLSVKDGYARNFLMPRRLAMPSSAKDKEYIETQRQKMMERRAKEQASAEEKAQALEGVKLSIEMKAGDDGKLYGSVTSQDVQAALEKAGHSFDKKQILIKEPIRTLGNHSVVVELYQQVKASVTVEVVAQA